MFQSCDWLGGLTVDNNIFCHIRLCPGLDLPISKDGIEDGTKCVDSS